MVTRTHSAEQQLRVLLPYLQQWHMKHTLWTDGYYRNNILLAERNNRRQRVDSIALKFENMSLDILVRVIISYCVSAVNILAYNLYKTKLYAKIYFSATRRGFLKRIYDLATSHRCVLEYTIHPQDTGLC